MLAHGIAIAFRRRNKLNASGFGIGDIDIFQPGTYPSDELEVGSSIQEGSINLEPTSNHNTLIVMNGPFDHFF